MQVTVNGEALTLAGQLNITELLAQLHLAGKRVAVEINGAIVPRSRHAETALHEGDQILIVQAIGGG